MALSVHGGVVVTRPGCSVPGSGHPLRRWFSPWGPKRSRDGCLQLCTRRATRCAAHTRAARSALALLVARVVAVDHDAAVATDHLALVTDLLDAGSDLHRST